MIKTSVADRLLLLCIMAGLALSVYSALETFLPGLEDACSPNSTISCRIVNESPYSHIGPLPVWTFGVGGFVFLLALDVLFLRTREARWLTYLFMLAGVGLVISVVLTLVEIFLIGAICPVCVASYVADRGVFLVAWRIRSGMSERRKGVGVGVE